MGKLIIGPRYAHNASSSHIDPQRRTRTRHPLGTAPAADELMHIALREDNVLPDVVAGGVFLDEAQIVTNQGA